ncbi:MAG: electron transfer flavoprotein subunit alpha/FixB family protein [Ferrimicrobium sp.]
MGCAVLVVGEWVVGEIPDVTLELLGKGRRVAGELGGELGIVVQGSNIDLSSLGMADVVYHVAHASLEHYAASAWEEAVMGVVEFVDPKVVLVSTGTVGMDLAGSMAVRLDATLVSYVLAIETAGDSVVCTSQLYGGKLLAETETDQFPLVVTVIPGSFPAAEGRTGGSPRSEVVELDDRLTQVGARPIAVHEPEVAGVDITAAPLLVSVGRGIGSEANVELVQELADAFKAPLSASRPVIDQGWLPKPHQVGKSGKKVTPSVYLSFGISGAPEHLEGMRGAETIIACNTDPHAPIFEVAHYGTTIDLFDLVPEITERLGG